MKAIKARENCIEKLKDEIFTLNDAIERKDK
jgi:hypothetical protein